jgi:(2Fe-2S) ferredoxin
LRAAAGEAGSVLRVSGCRGVCHLSNVVALRHDNHRIEVGHVLTESATNVVANWIRDPALVPDLRSGVVLIGPLGAVTPLVPKASPVEPSTARRS